jgi:16S rRNA processing protein RimM
MRVDPLLDDDRVFAPQSLVTLLHGNIREDRKIEFSRKQHGRLILKLQGIDSISQVESLVGAELSVSKEQLPPAEEGLYYTFQLKGCSVVGTNDELLGTVTDVLDSGGTYILKVDGPKGEILIPFAESYLRKVDLGQGRIDVDLPEGLADLNN